MNWASFEVVEQLLAGARVFHIDLTISPLRVSLVFSDSRNSRLEELHFEEVRDFGIDLDRDDLVPTADISQSSGRVLGTSYEPRGEGGIWGISIDRISLSIAASHVITSEVRAPASDLEAHRTSLSGDALSSGDEMFVGMDPWVEGSTTTLQRKGRVVELGDEYRLSMIRIELALGAVELFLDGAHGRSRLTFGEVSDVYLNPDRSRGGVPVISQNLDVDAGDFDRLDEILVAPASEGGVARRFFLVFAGSYLMVESQRVQFVESGR